MGPKHPESDNNTPMEDPPAATAQVHIKHLYVPYTHAHEACLECRAGPDDPIHIQGPHLQTPMLADAYQMRAVSTAIYKGRGNMIGRAYVALKLNGEAGEVAEEIGKSMRDDGGEITPERRMRLKKELGDVQWYIAAIAEELGYTLSEIMQANLAKLQDRAARGVLGGSGSDR